MERKGASRVVVDHTPKVPDLVQSFQYSFNSPLSIYSNDQ